MGAASETPSIADLEKDVRRLEREVRRPVTVEWDGRTQPRDPEPESCYYCDPYSYPGARFPGEQMWACWDHAQIIDRKQLPDVGLPSGKRASWKRGVWA